MRRFIALVSIVFACLASAPVALADIDTSPGAVPPSDADVLQGTLPNGMRWFIRHAPKPEKRVELRLAVKIGSVQETDEERGIAHFAEHMEFNGSENFKPGELIPWLESIGTRFGADSNAYTSYDETVYMLQIPTDKEGALDRGLLVMADWAGRATFEDKEIDKERGVVLDELRRGKGARKRIWEKQEQVLYKGSRYADRMTIGLESVITGASHDTVRGFYRKWYRPDVMAIIVVGDVDAKAMEAKVKEVFGALPRADVATAIPEWPFPPHDETLYSVESDKELTASSVQIVWKRAAEPTKTVGDYRRDAVRQIAAGILAMRLYERAQKPDPPFLGAFAGVGNRVKTLSTFTLFAQSKDGHLPEAAAALMEELERARRFGFVQPELERVKTTALAAAETRLKEAPQQRSDERVNGLVQAFLDDQVVTSDQYDHDLAKALLPGITLDEVNAAVREMTDTKSRVVLASAPQKDGVKVPTADELKAAIEPGSGFEVAAYVDDLEGKKLVDFEPTPGKVVARRKLPEVAAEELTLANGARIVVKATDFRADQILMRGLAQEGASTFGPQRYASAIRADTLADDSGLANFTAAQLGKYLQAQGVIAGASPGVSRFGRSFGGSARPQDIETMLQLVHLYFVKPAFRDEAFQRMVDAEVESIRNELNSPAGVYGRATTETLYRNHWLFRPATVELVKSLRKEEVEKAYREMFDDASEWTFFLVGNVDLDKHLPLIEKWIGSLPTTSAEPKVATRGSWEQLDLRFPAGREKKEIRKGIEDQSRTLFTFPADTGLDQQAEFDVDVATDLLEIKLREKLREDLGETYGVGAGYNSLWPYRRFGRISISWTSAPGPREQMMQIVRDTMKSMRATTPMQADVDKLKQMRLNDLDESEKENGWWLGQLYSTYVMNREPKTILDYRKRVDRLSVPGLRAAIRRWLLPSSSLEIYLLPENWTPDAAKAPAAEATASAPAGG